MIVIATLLAAMLVLLLIASGGLMTLWGVVLVATSGAFDDDFDGDDAQAGIIRLGVALLLAGLILFVAGATGAARLIA